MTDPADLPQCDGCAAVLGELRALRADLGPLLDAVRPLLDAIPKGTLAQLAALRAIKQGQ